MSKISADASLGVNLLGQIIVIACSALMVALIISALVDSRETARRLTYESTLSETRNRADAVSVRAAARRFARWAAIEGNTLVVLDDDVPADLLITRLPDDRIDRREQHRGPVTLIWLSLPSTRV